MEEFEKSSLRYVKKVNINPEMAHQKILSRIKDGSKVLEIGPASGAMTKIISEEKKCQVFIVEYDKDCFENAIQYAVDGICGDVENEDWINKFKNQKFQYITFVDVLEHLRQPWETLKRASELLAEDGSILISIPNVSHNSVIIQLLNNRFIYQDTGILDYSHLHHFTFTELQNLVESMGYLSVYLDATYISVGKNEFDISYKDVDPLIAELLKTRPFGEVYQHIIEIKKKEYVEANNIEIENRLGMPKEYVPISEQDMQETTNSTEDIMDILLKDPNFFFSTNEEISRLRLEINDLYNAIPQIENVKNIRNRLFEMQQEVKEKNNHIRVLQNEIDDRNKQITNLQNGIEEEKHSKDYYISQLQSEVEERNLHIKKLDGQIIEIERQRDKLQGDIRKVQKNLEENINILNSENKEFRDHIEILQRELNHSEGHVKALEDIVDQRNATISDIENRLNNITAERDALSYTRDLYEHEKNTKAYKIGKKLQKMYDGVLPHDSKRRFKLRIAYNYIQNPSLMKSVLTPANKKLIKSLLKENGIHAATDKYDEILKQQKDIFDDEQKQKELLEIFEKEENRIVFDIVDNPTVSIVIPVYNQFSYTYKCLRSIKENSGDVSYEIILGDDCSTDNTQKINRIVENITVIRNEKNLRFLLNCNNAAASARGKYILFLNNDTQVKEGWLKALLDTFEAHNDAGMVGSKLIYPDGRLQEAGGIIWKDASAWNYGHGQDPEASEFNYVKEADYISGAAIMINTDLWKKIGGFDTRFVPAYCEDSDLAFEVRKQGYKVYYQPKSVVIHFEGVSNGTDVSTGLKSYQISNSKKFAEKWKKELEDKHSNNGENVFVARDRSVDKKCILFIDHYVPQYDKDAGSRTVFAYLKMFVQKGYNVKFIGDNFYRDEPYTTTLQQMGIEVLYGPYYAQNWQTWIKNNAEYMDYIFMNRPHISVKYVDFVKKVTKAKIIYYGHDLHYLRLEREYDLTGEVKTIEQSKVFYNQEYDLMRKSDVVYYPSEVEVNEIKKQDDTVNAHVLTPYIFTDVQEEPFNYVQRKNLLFVGGFTHGPNVDAVVWFCNEILPKIKKIIPDIVFGIVGSNAPESIKKLDGKNIKVYGFVSDEKLHELYKSSMIAVIPLRYGAGIKGKVVEAMSQGVPIVTTTCGAEGIVNSENILCIEDDPDKMAQIICDLYKNQDKLETISKASYKYIKNYYSEDVAWNGIKKEFE